MPLSTQTEALADALEDLFTGDTAPRTTKDAARRWAQIYADYAAGGGVNVTSAAKILLETNLTAAFRPELAGGGIPLTIQALGFFWFAPPLTLLYTIPPHTLAVVSAFVPVGIPFPLPGQVPSTATVPEQAAALAQSLSAFTLASVIVTPSVPPPVGSPVPIP